MQPATQRILTPGSNSLTSPKTAKPMLRLSATINGGIAFGSTSWRSLRAQK
jgi:hypothetical protein